MSDIPESSLERIIIVLPQYGGIHDDRGHQFIQPFVNAVKTDYFHDEKCVDAKVIYFV